MTQQEKIQIVEHLRVYVEQRGSQNKAAKSLKGVSSATLSHLLNGEWESIADDMFRKIAAQIGCSSNDWQLAPTTNTQMLTDLPIHSQSNSLVFAVIGNAGSGKSTAFKVHSNAHKNVFRVECGQYWDRNIAIPDNGNYKLYLYTGATKTEGSSYLPTGISNVSAAQIDGLSSYMSDYIIGNMVLNRFGNSLYLGVERTIIDSSGNSSSFTRTFGVIDLDFMQLDLPINTNGYALPNTLRNNGTDLIYQDENGVDKPLLNGDKSKLKAGLKSYGLAKVYKPLDGVWTDTSSFSIFGAIRIELPIGLVDTINDISIDLCSAVTSQGFTAKLYGRFLSATNDWDLTSAMLVTKDNDLPIRFGHTSAGAPLVYIGELNTLWRFPILQIDKVKTLSNTPPLDGFNISLESSAFENEKKLLTNNKI